ncbi:Crp/Fnr family transcriptional regulator [Pedobacter cryoconitis]|uniref:CRP-like cAMP-binding protein n=1 Tax=Pedobacter cryoconitis TaxID=188932 RepID=A0A7X0MKR7_9SPHI|nr:Crp/Fnr family transcriptional regulator [Pedobacter cryoconitis]MBB6502817.1 CRP-like cAMP-binding protein [Pedobacter cryoconitis]
MEQIEINRHSFDALITFFLGFFTINKQERKELESIFVEKKIKRRKYILQPNEICKNFTFVISGCFKMLTTDEAGKEHILDFAAENNWICDMASFYSKTPSKVFIQAIEPSVIMQISWHDLIQLYIKYMKFNSTFRIIAERKSIELQNRILQNISLSSEQRYLNFSSTYPHLINRLPNTQIAAYLGITSEFLSKIRKELLYKG